MIQIRQTRTTTTSGQLKTTVKAAVSARNLQPQTSVRITGADVSDPERLARALGDIQRAVAQSANAARTNPLNAGGVHFKGVPVVAGVAFLLRHNMGRPYVGYSITRTQNAVSAVQIWEQALPSGITATQAVNLVPSATGTLDILVY